MTERRKREREFDPKAESAKIQKTGEEQDTGLLRPNPSGKGLGFASSAPTTHEDIWSKEDESRFFLCFRRDDSNSSAETSTNWHYESQFQPFVPGRKTRLTNGTIPNAFIISKVCDSKRIADAKKIRNGIKGMVESEYSKIISTLKDVCPEHSLIASQGPLQRHLKKAEDLFHILSSNGVLFSTHSKILDIPSLLLEDSQTSSSSSPSSRLSQYFVVCKEDHQMIKLVPVPLPLTSNECTFADIPAFSDKLNAVLGSPDSKVDVLIGKSAKFDTPTPAFVSMEVELEEQRHNLVFDILLALQNLKEGGSLILGTWGSSSRFTATFLFLLQNLFERIMLFKPTSSSKVSIERFVICTGFRHHDQVEDQLRSVAEALKIESRESAVLECVSITLLVDTPIHRYLTLRNNDLIDSELQALRDLVARLSGPEDEPTTTSSSLPISSSSDSTEPPVASDSEAPALSASLEAPEAPAPAAV